MGDKWEWLKDKKAAAEMVWELDEESLHQLFHLVAERWQLVAQERIARLMAQFRVGNKVSLHSHEGEEVHGVIVKMTKKMVTVHADDGRYWKASPQCISPRVTADSEPSANDVAIFPEAEKK